MPKTIRLNRKEEDALRDKCVELNKMLIINNKEPIKDSELVHIVLDRGVKNVRLDEEFDFYLDV